MSSILIIDDEKSICEILQMMLQQYDHKTKYALSGEEAKVLLANEYFDVIISDIRLPDINGIDLLEFVKKYSPDSEIILITAYASTESAIKALKLGASDYLIKPLDLEEVKITVDRCLEKKRLIAENILLRQSIESKLRLDNIIGNSAPMQKIFDLIKKVSATHSTILITGESGTGKDLIAKAIHHNSLRKNYPFVAINCGAMPETLLESELFGHVKGSFTGAFTNKKGLFEVANKGTIFLDEISEMPPTMQVKLLRVLQDKVIRRVGGNEEIPIDVRVIAATNVNLMEAVKSARFREDLFYRLNVINIEIPPLRKRKEDISLLAYYFLDKFNKELGKQVKKISKDAIRMLENYHWPGNVRELENAIARAVTLASDDIIDVEHLPDSILSIESTFTKIEMSDFDDKFNLENTIDEIRKYYILKALKKANGNQKKAAQYLQITPRSIRYFIKKLNINYGKFPQLE
jgi:DNA-binding NtrC family response regulator